MNSDVALLRALSEPKSRQTSYRMGMTRPKNSGIQLCCSAAALALLLAGCATTDSDPRPAKPGGTFTTGSAVITTNPVAPAQTYQPPPPRRLQVCDAKPVQFYIGHNTVPSTLETIRKKSGAYILRVLGNDQPATTDLDQERLNIMTNDAGRITALRCG